MSIVLRRDCRELRQTNAFRIMVISAGAATVAAAAGISIVLGRQAWLGEEAARPLLELIMGLVAYFLPLFVLLAFIWVSASLPIVREKVNGTIECLLATPLRPGALWMGKCLAVFLPGFGVSVIATLLVVLAINLVTIYPATGYFVLPAPALLTGLVVNPLLFFGLLAFMVLVALASNPDIAIAPSFILGFGLMMGVPLGVALGAIDLASWAFALWYLAGTAVGWAVVGYLSRLLTTENIVLSGKGD
ncbi:MAG: ABC transporter permease [Chloroflexota bacterium]